MLRRKRVRKGCKILGVDDIYFFGADDAVLLVTEEIVKTARTVVARGGTPPTLS